MKYRNPNDRNNTNFSSLSATISSNQPQPPVSTMSALGLILLAFTFPTLWGSAIKMSFIVQYCFCKRWNCSLVSMSRPYKKPRLAFYPFELGAPWVAHVRKARALNLIRRRCTISLSHFYFMKFIAIFLLYLYRFFLRSLISRRGYRRLSLKSRCTRCQLAP